MRTETTIQIDMLVFIIGAMLSYYGEKTGSPLIRLLGAWVIIVSFLPLLFFIGKAIKLALKGERTLIGDGDVIRDPATNEIMFDMDADGTVRSHDTGERLCKFDFDRQAYFDNDNNIVTFDTLDKEWLKKRKDNNKCPCPGDLSSVPQPETRGKN